ncbi:MAG: hypothetical protein WC701_00470 [Kiritimatiellales bacterium]
MKRTVSIMLVITALPLFMASAQNAARDKKPPQGRIPQLDKQKIEKKAEQRTDVKAELREKLNAEPSGESAEELNVSEYLLKRNDLKGDVIKLTFDKVASLKQAGKEGYVAIVTYESPRLMEGLNLIVPADGLEFFEELSKPGIIRRETVYVHVLNANMLKALGTRYREDKPEGERYAW